jgi:hypothetical protein
MTVDLSIHRVTAIRLEDRANDGHSWARIVITSTDYFGKESAVEITVFPKEKGATLRVDQPEPPAEEPSAADAAWADAPDRDSLGYTAGERHDIIDAGRGHLLP